MPEDILEIEAALENKDFHRAIRLAEKLLEGSPQHARLHAILGLSLAEIGDTQRALFVIGESMKLYSPEWGPYPEAYALLDRSRAIPETKEAFWKSCNSNNELAFEEAKVALAEKDPDRARQAVLDVCRTLFSEKMTEEFLELFDVLCGHPVDVSPEKFSYFSGPLPRLVFVSGTGWSGSSAIFDYLCEFEQVIPVPGEWGVFRGLSNLRKKSQDAEEFRLELINFFFTFLVGFRAIKSWLDCKYMGQARELPKVMGIPAFIELLRDFRVLAMAAIKDGNLRETGRAVEEMAKLFTHSIIGRRQLSSENVVVFDNAINISRIESLEVFQTAESLACFRDPRSNYADNCRNNPFFALSATEYVNQEKHRQARFRRRLGKYRNQQQLKVTPVQFEEFVLSESLRESLAVSIGLDLTRRKKHQYFKPWESACNVFTHLEHPAQEEIDAIREHLGEFCVEPTLKLSANGKRQMWFPDSRLKRWGFRS